jgi:hypothetical protein
MAIGPDQHGDFRPIQDGGDFVCSRDNHVQGCRLRAVHAELEIGLDHGFLTTVTDDPVEDRRRPNRIDLRDHGGPHPLFQSPELVEAQDHPVRPFSRIEGPFVGDDRDDRLGFLGNVGDAPSLGIRER